MSAVTQDDGADDLEPETDDGAAVSILTNGDPIRSWTRLPTAIVDEAKVRFDSDGIHLRAVDRANTSMVEVTAHAEGFDRFDVDGDVLFGLNFDKFRSAVQWARKRGGDGDPVSIEVFEDPQRMRVAVTRPDQGMKRISEWFGIDPDAIRDRPDLPDLDLPNRADPSPKALHDAIGALSDHQDYAYVTRDDETFVVASRRDGQTRPDEDASHHDAVYMPNTAWDVRDDPDAGACSSLFTLDYLTDMVGGLKRSKADRVTVKWADDFPTKIQFEHEEWGFSGQFMLAPRVESDDE